MRSNSTTYIKSRRRMMATEATQENFADASNVPENQNVLTEPRQDVPSISTPPPVNGEASSTDGDKLEKESALQQPTSAAVSISGGSDTEASKGENSKLQADDKGQGKTASVVKKPTSFKAVTVNKTFLAAKVATGTATSKLGENKPVAGSATLQTGPSISAVPRPRLVAKTGSGLRDSAPRSSTSINGGKPGSAPDPSAVWNKNRPAPPPEVKRLTDEDLRKQYGIHLATRIQGDDQGGKQANWADIDEDEDDWAPEEIEWTDGTKISLHQADEPAPAPAEPTPAKAPMAASELSKPQSPAPTSNTPTVRLGGISGGPGKGLILKGAAEKPTLVAKPPGPPAPVKSPWAPLPPVDKVAPVVIEPQPSQPQPQQHATPRFHQKDPHGFEGMPPPPPPTKEIAADDFSRAWRDNSQAQNRELYNSQSGRYEPVTDNRRNSRNDIHSRGPALLQRPTNHEQQGPAEPSGAFQTHRSSGDNSYGRRRNSSNVSGGSGNIARRISFSRGEMSGSHEMSGPRRGSLAAVSDSPSSPRNFSPAAPYPGQRNSGPWQSRASPATSHNSPSLTHGQMLPPPIPNAKQLPPVEDEVELQKKVMADSREAARKRRSELEAKEEAEKKERIRVKLEAMGPPPDTKKQKKDAVAEEKAMPTQIQVREPGNVPSKTLAPEMTAEVKQPSTEKVEHVPKPATQPPLEQDRDISKFAVKDSALNRPTAPEERRNASDHVLPQSQSNSAQPWQSSAQQSKQFQGWNGSSQSSATRNVWGHHGIGNGSFGIQDNAVSQTGPGAIGPPSSYRSNNQQSRGKEQYNNRPNPIAPPNGQSATQRSVRQPQNPGLSSSWGNAHLSIAESDKKIAAERAAAIAARKEKEAIEGIKEPERLDTWKQVGLGDNGERSRVKSIATIVKPATVNGVPSQVPAIPGGLLGTSPLAPNGVRHDAVSGSMPTNNASISGMNVAPSQPRSRFFPHSQDIRLEEPNTRFGRSSSPPPPPPTMSGHPAYDGDMDHPRVCFPLPSPVVRLPPARLAPIGPPKPAPSFAAAVAGSNHQSMGSSNFTNQSMRQDVRQHPVPASGDWQNKISTLLNRKPSPPKSYALAVDSSSKHAFELSEARTSATVTLPGSRSGVSGDDETSFTSKPMSEECFEEQEMGSRPVCNLPRPSTAPRIAAPRPKPNPQKPKSPEATSAKFLTFSPDSEKGGPTVGVRLPGMDDTKNIPAPFLSNNRNGSRPGRGGGGSRGGLRGNSSRGNPHNNRGGRREASSNYPSSKVDDSHASSPNNHPVRESHPTRSRGRGFGSAGWGSTASRHVSNPVTSK